MHEIINTLARNKKPLLVGLCLLAVAALWVGGSVVSLVHNKLEKRKLMHQTVALEQEYQTLLQTKKLLEAQDPVLLEKIARTQYHLAKPKEIEFRFTPN